jgi:hypothetical protein
MKIDIETWPGVDAWGSAIRGRKKVLVDGVHWGAFTLSMHGCHGGKYTLEGVDDREVVRPTERGGRSYEVWSDSKAAKRAEPRRGT